MDFVSRVDQSIKETKPVSKRIESQARPEAILWGGREKRSEGVSVLSFGLRMLYSNHCTSLTSPPQLVHHTLQKFPALLPS